MSEYRLLPDENIDVAKILEDLKNYRPRRRGWTWREPAPNLTMGPFNYHDCSQPLKDGVPLPPAHYFGDVDPQPMPVITTEIASGRFEDDIRRMRMAAHHGADHRLGLLARRMERRRLGLQRRGLDLFERNADLVHQILHLPILEDDADGTGDRAFAGDDRVIAALGLEDDAVRGGEPRYIDRVVTFRT